VPSSRTAPEVRITFASTHLQSDTFEERAREGIRMLLESERL